MVTRAQWKAEQPKTILTELELPATRVIISHTAGRGGFSQVFT